VDKSALDLRCHRNDLFQLLFGLLILRHHRRRVLWMGVTAHLTAEWIARQLTEINCFNVNERD